LSGEDAVRAAENESWDPSVKSLLPFPHVLARMDEDLQWLQTLGDAFLGQEPHVMDAVQNLRRRAQVAGNLRSDERQRILETGPVLVVQPADPQIIYVPYYDPRVVYGPWWWPNYSPVHWRPFPGYGVWPGLAGGFHWGPSIRISVGYFFGGFDWPRRHVRVVQSNYYYRAPANHRVSTIHLDRPPGSWQHDPLHRRGVAYRGAEVQQRFADAGARPDGGRHPDRDDARRQNQQRAQSYPTLNRRGDVDRPAVQARVLATGPDKVHAVIQPVRQPNPALSRPRESRNDASRTAVQPVGDAPAQAALQRVAVTQAHSGNTAGADRRDQGKDLQRGDRSPPVVSRQATQAASTVPQAQRNRSNATPAPGGQAEVSARFQASGSKQEPRASPAIRQETQRGAERHRELPDKPEARRDSGWQRGASADDASPQLRHQR
jgi:hypothetical protein